MPPRPYQVDRITILLGQEILRRRAGHNLFLPSERTLSESFGCSRETLRRAIETLESRKVLLKGPKGRVIAAEPSSEVIGRFAFVSAGRDVVGNPAWAKLWACLSPLAAEFGLRAELVLYGWDDPQTLWPGPLREPPPVVVFTNAPHPFIREQVLSLPGTTLIVTDEDLGARIPNLVAMDNYEAGRLAALRLAERGYQRPAFLGWKRSFSYLPFEKRARGFRDGAAEAGLRYDNGAERWFNGDTRAAALDSLRVTLDALLDGDFDSLFFYSDPDIDLVYDAVARRKRIPDDFGLITLNSFSQAVGRSPQIDSVSHGTHTTAAALVREILRLFETGERTFGPVLAPPRLHDGGTLRPAPMPVSVASAKDKDLP